MKIKESDLRSGANLFYGPPMKLSLGAVFSWAICIFTTSRICHCEMYKGDGVSYASRDGTGVGEYPLRLNGLVEVRYATQPLNMGAVAIEAAKHKGEAYDNGTIVTFLTLGKMSGALNRIGRAVSVLTRGRFGWIVRARVCSEHLCCLDRAGGLTELFGETKASKVLPNDFTKQSLLRRWKPYS